MGRDAGLRLISRVMVSARRPTVAIFMIGLIGTMMALRAPVRSDEVTSDPLMGRRSPRANGISTRPPLYFERNEGQTFEAVRFVARAPAYNVFLTATGAGLVFPPDNQPARVDLVRDTMSLGITNPPDGAPASSRLVRMTFAEANSEPLLQGIDQLPGRVNYFVGNDSTKWRTGIPTYAGVRYHNVYDGIDVVYREHQGRLEYDWHVAPGADPARIVMRFEGADDLTVDHAGALVIRFGDEVAVQPRPRILQSIGGVEHDVSGSFVLARDGEVRFAVGAYDRTAALVIDPEIIYTRQFGGSGSESLGGMVVDASGAIYLTGSTSSLDFPVTPDAIQPTAFGTDAYVVKLTPDASRVVFATYLGGRGQRSSRFGGHEMGSDIAVDASGNAYVTGHTYSTDFPVANAVESSALATSGPDGFVAKLNPTGTELIYSTYIGGRDGETRGVAIAVDAAQHAYVGGTTAARQLATGTDLSTANGTGAIFVRRFNPAGGLVYSTRFGGTQADRLGDLAVDGSGNVVLTGTAVSRDFPVVLAFQSTCPGQTTRCGVAFVSKLDVSGRRLVYSTYLGGGADQFGTVNAEEGTSVAVDASGAAIVCGTTRSPNFPVRNALWPTFGGGGGDVFLARLGVQGALTFATFLGGSGSESGERPRVALDAQGQIVVTGFTSSTDFPISSNALLHENPDGPLFRSADRGDTWTIKKSGLPSGVVALALDPSDSRIAYAGTFSGVYKSTDRGETWHPTGSVGPAPLGVWGVAVHPREPSSVVAGTTNGVYRSADGGSRWTKVYDAAQGSLFTVIVDPHDPNVMYGASNGVRRSDDGGWTWADSSAGLPRTPSGIPWVLGAIAVDPKTPGSVYVGAYGGLFRSTDYGRTWNPVPAFPSSGVWSIAVDPTNSSIVFVGTTGPGLLKTIDGGETWQGISDSALGHMRAMAIDPQTPTIVYGLTSSPNRLLRSTDGGATWQLSNPDVVANAGGALVLDPADPSIVYTSGILRPLPFVTILASTSALMDFSTFLPGSVSGVGASALAVDASGQVVVAFQNIGDVVITKINP